MDRETIELVLPKSGAKVVLYQYLTTGENRQLQRLFLSKMPAKFKQAVQEVEFEEIDATIQLDAEDLALKLLIKSIVDKAGADVPNPVEYVANLSKDDGDLVYAKINELSRATTLTKEVKKK